MTRTHKLAQIWHNSIFSTFLLLPTSGQNFLCISASHMQENTLHAHTTENVLLQFPVFKPNVLRPKTEGQIF
jgi:hypothetical protein